MLNFVGLKISWRYRGRIERVSWKQVGMSPSEFEWVRVSQKEPGASEPGVEGLALSP